MSIFSPTFFQEFQEIEDFEISQISYGNGSEEALIKSPKIGFSYILVEEDEAIHYTGKVYFLDDAGEIIFEFNELGDKKISSLTVNAPFPEIIKVGNACYDKDSAAIDKARGQIQYTLERSVD